MYFTITAEGKGKAHLVADGKVDRRAAEGFQTRPCAAVKNGLRLAALRMHDLDIPKAKAAKPAAKGLGAGLLGRPEAGRGLRALLRDECPLALREHAGQKTRVLQGVFHPLYFAQIAADADHASSGSLARTAF